MAEPTMKTWTGGDIRTRLIPAIARRSAGRSMQLAGASVIYDVPSGWQSDVLAGDPAICIAHDADTLQTALRAPGCGEIFVPAGAALTRTLIERHCVAASLTKTIYRESAHAGT